MFKIGEKYIFIGESGPTWRKGKTYKVLALKRESNLRPIFSSEDGEIMDDHYGWDYTFIDQNVEGLIKESWKKVGSKKRNLPHWW